MSSILVATDLTERTQAAVSRAAQLTRANGGEWTLLQVVPEGTNSQETNRIISAAQDRLQEYGDKVSEQAGVQPQCWVMSGQPSATIIKGAEMLGATLVVLGAHGKSGIKEFFLGTTVQRIIRATSVPVLRVGEDVQGPYQRVLAAYDLGPVSIGAIHEANRLGMLDLDNFDIAYAAELMPIGGMAEVVPDAQVIDSLVAEAKSKVEHSLSKANFKVPQERIHVLDGDPNQVLNNVLDKTGSDLLVVGTHGRTGVMRLVMGSVASALLAGLKVDVLVVAKED